jgi:hypothetical protein
LPILTDKAMECLRRNVIEAQGRGTDENLLDRNQHGPVPQLFGRMLLQSAKSSGRSGNHLRQHPEPRQGLQAIPL